MKTSLLIAGIGACGFLAVAKIWGLIFLEFSAKQLIYAVALLVAAIGMFVTLRGDRVTDDSQP